MTAQDQSTLRTIILQTSRLDETPAARLLSQLGHDVTASTSAADAIQLIQTDRADLVVIDAEKIEEAQPLVDRISALDESQRPKVVAVLTDRGADLARLRRGGAEATSPRVRVFLKPLHMHGLLDIVKRLERSAVD
jgi:CheY-like chemotaxis protein